MVTDGTKVANFKVSFFAETNKRGADYWTFNAIPQVVVERMPKSTSVFVGWGFWSAGVEVDELDFNE